MNRNEFRQRMNNYKKARESNPSLSYWDFLEKLSEAKSKEWNEDQDLVFIQMANDNTYNYRQMYEDNPNYNIEKGHFTDKYKTVYHPTFSNESIYSGEKSEYNPKGSVGGSWDYENKQFILGPDQNLDYSQQYLDIADPGWKAVRKYADGTDEVTNNKTYFIEDWLNQRKDILGENVSRVSLYNFIKQAWNNREEMGQEELNRQLKNIKNSKEYEISQTPKRFPSYNTNPQLIQELKTEYANYFSDEYRSPEEVDEDDLPLLTFFRKGAHNRKSGNISYEENPSNSIIIHERTHASDPIPQKNKINLLRYDRPNDFFRGGYDNIYLDGVEKSYYYDSDSEIYSRLMQFRYDNKLNPKKKYTIEDIQKMRQNNTIKDSNLLNRYKDEYIQRLLNDVATIDKENVIRAENGTDGIIDELKSNSRSVLTPEEQQYLLSKSRQRQRMSGAITPMFDIQDAADLTPIGDVLTARDTYNAFKDQDYIRASAMLGLMLAPPALGRIAKEKIPSFVTAAADKINELRRKERRNKELDTKIFSQGIEDRNRIIEELYDTPDIWDRAYNADINFGTNYVDTYNDLINNYYSNYFNLPEPKRINIGDAKAKMTATQDAIDRYNLDGTPASWGDFEYLINPDIENLDKALTRHELGHYVDFNMSRSSNPDAGNLMFDAMKKDLSIDPNPMIPSETSYFRTGSEQKSYMNTLRQFMFDNNMINKIDDKVTTKKIQEAIDKLPSELNSVKAAYKQFKSPRKYTKWFNTIPLLGVTPFMLNYSEENNSN